MRAEHLESRFLSTISPGVARASFFKETGAGSTLVVARLVFFYAFLKLVQRLLHGNEDRMLLRILRISLGLVFRIRVSV